MPIIGTLPATLINGVTADAPTVQSMFDYIKAQVNANAAASGANSDITALLGLTTPIGRNFGGSSAFISTSASTGSANAQVVASLIPNSFTKTEGNRFYFEAGYTNTGATQFNLNGTGLTDVRKQTPSGVVALTGGEIVAGDVVSGYYDGTYYVLLDDKTAAFGPATNLASASTTDLGTIPSRNVVITGTTTITSFGSTAITSRPLYFIRFTGALTLTYNASSLIIPGAGNITTADGDSALVEYLGSGNWRVRSYQRASMAPGAAAVGGAFRGLSISVTSNTALTVAANAAVLIDSSNNPLSFTAVSESIATGSTGAGGLDTGSMANDTWYAVWLIAKPDGTIDAMLSTSATSPTMPSGYTYKMRMGWVRSDGSANLYRTKQVGNKAVYVIGTNPTVGRQLASGAAGSMSAPTWVAVATGSYVPTTAVEILIYATTEAPGVSSTYGIMVAPNNSYGAYNSGTNPPPIVGYYAIGTLVGLVTICGGLVLESTDIYWASSGSVSELYCQGWIDNV